jgi:transposase
VKIADVGIDVAKAWIDVCVLVEERTHERRFDRSAIGLKQSLKWLLSLQRVDSYNIAFEPTGRYSETVAEFFYAQPKFKVYQVNTVKFEKFRASLDCRVSTDRVNAWALAVYANERAQKPERYGLRQYEPLTESQSSLRDVGVRIRSLYKRKSMLVNQLECGLTDKRILADIAAELESIETSIESTLQYALTIIGADPQLKEDVERLESILGIGAKTAATLVSLVEFRRFKSSRSLTIFLGLTTKLKESGSSIRGKERITKAGNKHVRAALYFPAMTAMQHNPQLREFADGLKARGKLHPVIRTAVTRKLVVLAWTLINKGTTYDATYSRTPA